MLILNLPEIYSVLLKPLQSLKKRLGRPWVSETHLQPEHKVQALKVLPGSSPPKKTGPSSHSDQVAQNLGYETEGRGNCDPTQGTEAEKAFSDSRQDSSNVEPLPEGVSAGVPRALSSQGGRRRVATPTLATSRPRQAHSQLDAPGAARPSPHGLPAPPASVPLGQVHSSPPRGQESPPASARSTSSGRAEPALTSR